MKMYKISEFKVGELFFTTEAIGDEVREVYYIRTDDERCRWPSNVRAARFAIAQGARHYPPRYKRVVSALDANAEIDGRVSAYRLDRTAGTSFYSYLRDELPDGFRIKEEDNAQ